MEKTKSQQIKNEEKKDPFEFVKYIFFNKESWGPFSYDTYSKRININDIVGIYK
uniref:Uncharacterized protein n=1 Tax=viral metagenome TaxID=1070528 RepID=A0A6C0KYY9_9ZZZZ|tara:strand:- start:11490 stop:11651 length:162 start_codon:yes stop_codon:yes gene_type:complete